MVEGFELYTLNVDVTYGTCFWGETCIAARAEPRGTANEDPRSALHCVVQAASEMAELNATIKQLQDAVSLK